MSDPAISVVMSVYNAGDSLRKTLDSLEAQTERDFEIVAVDDGSTDATAAQLDDFAARDRRVRVIHQENSGLTRALMAGCAATRGAYIARQDAGDVSLPERLAKQRAVLDASPDVAFVSCWTELIGPEDEHLTVLKGRGKARTPIEILDARERWGVVDGPSSHPSVMFRREAYERAGGYRAEFYVGQDWDLWYRLGAAGKFQMIEEVLYAARVGPNDLSVGAREAQARIARLSRAALEARLRGESDAAILAEAAGIRPRRGTSRYRRAAGAYFIGEALRRNGDARARRYFRDAIAASPFYWRAWLRYAQSWLR
ncbi:MAG TPA: glycosyltransferase family 2 protein [Thermoanaerobaculia bacterium]|nr:glycosyltransferase family 2 protein [Thermoanaerobaculia bacterium]